jgi:hypothetical protein
MRLKRLLKRNNLERRQYVPCTSVCLSYLTIESRENGCSSCSFQLYTEITGSQITQAYGGNNFLQKGSVIHKINILCIELIAEQCGVTNDFHYIKIHLCYSKPHKWIVLNLRWKGGVRID